MKNEKRKTIYDRKFKLKFMGYGDWLDEPDVVKFEYKGIKCEIHRCVKREIYAKEEAYFGGHLCGYIFVPKGHPLYEKEMFDIDLDCWRGVSFTHPSLEGWMIGFDCAHSGDLVPTTEHMRNTRPELKRIKEMFPPPEGYENCPLFHPTYKNIDFCIKQCKSMAKQAAKMMAAV